MPFKDSLFPYHSNSWQPRSLPLLIMTAQKAKKTKKAIIVSGTPGTGKTSLAKELSHLLDYTYFDVAEYIKKAHLAESYDKKRACLVVDEAKLARALAREIKKSQRPLVIDHHMSHFLPMQLVKLAVITTCKLTLLKKRLEKRGYDREKVRDNLEAEAFSTCLSEARELGHRVLVLDTSVKTPLELAKRVKSSLRTRRL